MLLLATAAMANKTSVEIKTPAEAKKGTEITITIQVSHNGNTRFHHTDWVYLKINGKEVKRWTYSAESLPPGGDFTLEYKVTLEGDLAIEVQGDCNLHGSAGPKKMSVKAQ